MRSLTQTAIAYVVACLAILPPGSIGGAATPAKLSGSILGMVTNAAGVPQMGAAVLLFNRQERLFQRVLTDEKGSFRFTDLAPDLYSVHVRLASFVPVVKNNIAVQPGVQSLLNINLSGLLGSIQLVYPSPEQRALMTDEWKWALRTSSATRPVLRLLPVANSAAEHHVFSETRGLVSVSAGDGGRVTSLGTEADLGTAFALATSLLGNNQLEVSGNLGYGGQSGIPSAAFRTSYSRAIGLGTPEISVTMRQLFAPARMGAALVGGFEGNLPALRTMSLSFEDRTPLSDSLTFQYGFSLDSVYFLDRLNYFSPYARLSYSLGSSSNLDFTYTSGSARPDLGSPEAGPEAAMQNDLNGLALFPRVSVRGARAKVQRGENVELGYSHKIGSRTFRVSGYKEHVSNAGLTMVAPAGLYTRGDILPDLFSTTSVFNAGAYQSLGYTLSVTQSLRDHLSAGVTYGSVGALTAPDQELASDSPEELRSMLHVGRGRAITAQATATSPWTGTHMIASYQWTDLRMATPGHLYSTRQTRPEAGLNFYLRQPIPTHSGLPWRMEANADLRNLLAQGYLPLSLADGRRLLLVHTPRSVRGGLSFIF